MVSLVLAVALATVTGGKVSEHDYTLAYKRSVEEQKPLMVVVGADWCPACNALKNTTMRSLEQSGELANVSVAMVDRDAEPELARKLMKGEGMIPQIIVYSKNESGRWQSKKLTGFQSTQPIRSLLRRAVSAGRS